MEFSEGCSLLLSAVPLPVSWLKSLFFGKDIITGGSQGVSSVSSCHLPLSAALLYKNDVQESTTMNPLPMPVRLGITVGFDCSACELPSPSSVFFLGTEVGGLPLKTCRPIRCVPDSSLGRRITFL